MCDKDYLDSKLKKNLNNLKLETSNCTCGCHGVFNERFSNEPNNMKKVSVKKR